MPRGWTGSAPWNARGTRSPLPPVTTRRRRCRPFPGWNIDELLRHVGIAHHRAALILREGRTEPPPLEETSPPHGGSLSWYGAGLAALLDAMRSVDPATPVWTFSRSDPTATFWHRRMAHETVVHRVDAEQATGAVGPLGPALVLDGIAESLEVFAPLMARREQDPATATVHLHATDVEGEWLLTLGGSTVAVEHGHAKATPPCGARPRTFTCGCGAGSRSTAWRSSATPRSPSA
jgi:uncharacterized protein (TIGR03083 family)